MLGLLVLMWVVIAAVVEADSSSQWLQIVLEGAVVGHHTDVPYLQELVFAVGCQEEAIALACHIGYALLMTDEHTGWRVASIQRSPIPDLDEAVVRAREEKIAALTVGPAHRVDLVLVCVPGHRGHSVLHHVVDEDVASFRATKDLLTVTGELDAHKGRAPVPVMAIALTRHLEVQPLMLVVQCR